MNVMPSSARTSRVSVSTAVSGSHIPSGNLPNLRSKSSIPHFVWVFLSARLARGIIIWLYTWDMAEPCPENRATLSLSAATIDSWSSE